MPGFDERIRRDLERLAPPETPSPDLFERVAARKTRRAQIRRGQVIVLAAVVLAGTGLGTYALSTLFTRGPRASQDIAGTGSGGLIAFSAPIPAERSNSIYLLPVAGGPPRRVTRCENASPCTDSDASWSPDGTTIAFSRSPGNTMGCDASCETEGEIFLVRADGSELRRISDCQPPGCLGDSHPTWSPDGRRIAFSRNRGGNDVDIYVTEVSRSALRPLVSTREREMHPTWSPDGTKIAFSRNRDLYVANADGTNPRRVLHCGPGLECAAASSPAWSPDGASIAFVIDAAPLGRGVVGVMDARGGGVRASFSCAEPRCKGYLDVAWSPDGKRLAVVALQNWPHLYLIGLEGTTPARVNARAAFAPSWQPVVESAGSG